MKLKNQYFILRHGLSKANDAGIILSHPKDGVREEFSLTAKGEGQIADSVTKTKDEGWLNGNTLIISSPFSRCRRSAEIAQEILGVKTIGIDDRLRERWFGNWERKSDASYEKVWEIDKLDPDHTIELVESAQQVQERVSALIEDLEKKYADQSILLVSHGDALQILRTWFAQKSPATHREIDHLEIAEIRRLN